MNTAFEKFSKIEVELLKIEMSSFVLVELIMICESSKFSKISDEVLMGLLNNEETDIRKFASLKIIQSFKKNRIKSLLNKYVVCQDYRYYNVIFWLDFGVSMPKSTTKKAVNFILNK